MFDIGFTKDGNWFRYRAGAIIVEEGCVLLAGNRMENYLYSIGGGVKFGEKAEDAVVREVYEETGIRYEVDYLAVIHENLFNDNSGTLKGLNCHEICLYYVMKSRGSRELNSNSYTRFGTKEEMHWIPVESLGEHRVFPVFLKDYLSRPHSGIEHIVTDDRKV